MSYTQMKEIMRKARENPEAPQRLTHDQIEAVIKTIFRGCSHDNKDTARFKLAYHFNRWVCDSYIERMFFRDDGSADIIAGQDHSADIRQLRRSIICM